jgi:hypothetical protein
LYGKNNKEFTGTIVSRQSICLSVGPSSMYNTRLLGFGFSNLEDRDYARTHCTYPTHHRLQPKLKAETEMTSEQLRITHFEQQQ